MNDRKSGHRPTRTVGFWLAVAMSALQALNAVRTFDDPEGFAIYMGVPITGAEQAAWVQIYGLRAAFVAVLTAIFLARIDLVALRWVAIAAIVMPLGDASIASAAGAPASIIGRHLAIAVFLLVAAHFLLRASRQIAESESGV
jgi:hypothetical protein